MKAKTIGKIAGVGISFLPVVDALADGEVDFFNYSNSTGDGHKVDISEINLSGRYLRGPASPLRIYGWGPSNGDPNDHAIAPVGINSNGYNKVELRLEAETIANGSDNVIWVNPYGSMGEPGYSPLNMEKRNIILRKDPNSPSSNKDNTKYDLIDLTNGFTEWVQIGLDDITESTSRSPAHYDAWQFISTKREDANFDGRVNMKDLAHLSNYFNTSGHGPHDNHADFADVNQDGDVDLEDVACIRDEWLWNESGELVSKVTGQTSYDMRMAQRRKGRKAFAKRRRQGRSRAA